MRFKLKVVERAGMRLKKPHQCLGEDNVNKVTTQHEHCVFDEDEDLWAAQEGELCTTNL